LPDDMTAMLLPYQSSYIGPERTDSTRRWDKSRKEYVGIPRPFVVKSCNNLMGGIDFWTLWFQSTDTP